MDEPVPAVGQNGEESAWPQSPAALCSLAQTPLERVGASGQAGWRVAKLRELCSTQDPCELANRIDRKLENIYALANRRPKPKARKFALRDGCRKAAPRKSLQKEPSHRAWKSPQKEARLPLSHSHHSGYSVTSFSHVVTRPLVTGNLR
jgi:hypothetical protein